MEAKRKVNCNCGTTWVTNNICDSCGKTISRTIKDLKQGESLLVAGLDMDFYEMRNGSPVFIYTTDNLMTYYHIKDYNENTLLSEIK